MVPGRTTESSPPCPKAGPRLSRAPAVRAEETSVNAARFQQTRVLQNMLDLGVDPPIGEDDEEVNPLIKALQRGYWDPWL